MFEELITQFGLLGIFLASFISNALIILPVPADLLVIAATSQSKTITDALIIALVAAVAAGIGNLGSYIIGMFGKKIATKLLKGHSPKVLDEWKEKLGKKGMLIVFIGSATPVPLDVIALVAGVIRYDWRLFLVAATAGKIVRYGFLAITTFYGANIISGFI